MKNERAVEVIKNYVGCYIGFLSGEVYEAMELAIKALEERPQGELKEYKPLEIDYNVKSAVENLKTAYWSNDSEKYAQAFAEADQMIVSAICHYGYIVVKGGDENA